MSASKDRGTRWETAVADFLNEHYPDWNVRRLPPAGVKDIGDLDGVPYHAAECKDEARHQFAEYLRQAAREAQYKGADFTVVYVKRRGKGPGDGYAVRDIRTDARLIERLRRAEGLLAAYLRT